MKGVYLKKERSLFGLHIVRIKEKGVRKIGNILGLKWGLISCFKNKIKYFYKKGLGIRESVENTGVNRVSRHKINGD